jgi:hypothetical protein
MRLAALTATICRRFFCNLAFAGLRRPGKRMG